MLPQNISVTAHPFSPSQVAAEEAKFMRQVYAFMSLGLGATALAALWVVHSPRALQLIFGHPLVFYGLLIAELVMVASFTSMARRVGSRAAAALFFGYALLNGLTLSLVFLVYTRASIGSAFLITAGTFAGMSAFGYLTKRNLDGLGHFMSMGLWGLILASVVNLFLGSPLLYWAVTYFGVLVFVGLTAYDTQKIKQLSVVGDGGSDASRAQAIHGALILYLDFINLFLFLLRLFGRRR